MYQIKIFVSPDELRENDLQSVFKHCICIKCTCELFLATAVTDLQFNPIFFMTTPPPETGRDGGGTGAERCSVLLMQQTL